MRQERSGEPGDAEEPDVSEETEGTDETDDRDEADEDKRAAPHAAAVQPGRHCARGALPTMSA